ncbi:MAG TPA: hypothetical protein VF406_02755 [Thermodesulfobacteriota bacterium]
MPPLTKTGTLPKGLKIGGEVHRAFVLREATTQDYFDAETEVPTERFLTFHAALLCRQLVRVGTFEGPFTLAMLGTLHPADFDVLRQAQRELERLGEGESLGSESGSTPSSSSPAKPAGPGSPSVPSPASSSSTT